MARAAAIPPLPLDVRLAQVGANVLLAMLGAMVVGAALTWLAARPVFALGGIVLEGDLTHNTALTVRAAVHGRLSGSFLSIDLDHTREVFESVPWVRHAAVRRVFPNRIAVRLEEHRTAALWSEEADEDEQLVNTFGELFEANAGDVDDDLPQFTGPPDSAARMLDMYRALQPALQPLGSPMRTLTLTRHGTWRTRLDSGLVIELGRGDPAAVGERAARFVRTLPQITASLQQPESTKRRDGLLASPGGALLHADLRHPDGYALRLQGVKIN